MIRVAQLLLVAAAIGLWAASRVSWVAVTSFDELSPPKTATIDGAAWSTALLPLAVLLVTAALAGLAVRGWLLRAVALLLAVASFALGYLGLSLIVMPDVGPRGAELAEVPIAALVASERHLTGAVVTLVAAVAVLVAAVLMMRAAVSAAHGSAKSIETGTAGTDGSGGLSARGIWDALDDGRDPTASEPTMPDSSDAEHRPELEGR